MFSERVCITYMGCNWFITICLCFVLSIRSEEGGGEEEARFWNDIERALARLGRGMLVVEIKRRNKGEVLGIALGSDAGPEWTFSNAFAFVACGQLYDCECTFEQDKRIVEAVASKDLVEPTFINVIRAVSVPIHNKVIWVASLKDLDEKLFNIPSLIRLGSEQVIEGNGEADIGRLIIIQGPKFPIDDKRNWLPNSLIYDIEYGEDNMPEHVINQTLFLIGQLNSNDRDDVFALLLYHEVETDFKSEAVHGCIMTIAQCDDGYVSETVDRIHVPRSSAVLQSFKALHSFGAEENQRAQIMGLGSASEAVSWIWEDKEISGDMTNAEILTMTNRYKSKKER